MNVMKDEYSPSDPLRSGRQRASARGRGDRIPDAGDPQRHADQHQGHLRQVAPDRLRRASGREHCYACGSGTGAIHAAIAAVDPEPGDEIITSPITDMGAITPIIYQTAVPVFADVDPITGNVTAETIERMIGPKTRAIIVTHLFGNPADMGPIMALANRHGIPVIEDCAQAYGATYDGKPIGTRGGDRLFQPSAGQAHHHRRRRPGRHQRRPFRRAACGSSSTRHGAMAIRSRITTSPR